jgi:hypothetical protein
MPNGLFTLSQATQAIRQGAWTGFISPKWVEYLVVAGGGGGGSYGGGGAGGLLSGVVTVVAETSYTVTVGAGGSGSGQGVSGVNSVFGSVLSLGGGGGGGSSAFNFAFSGGSGGGGGQATTTNVIPGQGTSGQGNRGGTANSNNTTFYPGGGGGGAGTVGLDGSVSGANAGNGGAGIASDISGVRTTYAGGGAGGAWSSAGGSVGGIGGVGGGGNGGSTTTTMTAGGGNTGGGGGALGSGGLSGANGGSGVVIVRYPGTVQYFTGGTLSFANGYVIHTFFASGTLAPTTPTPYVAADYQISRSLRFNSADSTYLNRTPASSTNQKTWTWSAWVKVSEIAATGRALFQANIGGIYLYENQLLTYFGTSPATNVQTSSFHRDPSAWYHFVVAIDTTQATASDRIKFYTNGQRQPLTNTTYPPQNADLGINSANQHTLSTTFAPELFNGYMTEVNFIDGQQLTPSSFGHNDFNTGAWVPHKYVGAYGTNGFYLNFSDNSNTTAATLGADSSGNSNNWTPNNFSVAAGAGNDSMVDTPTPYGTDTGVGGSVRGNYATLNPLAKGAACTLSNGNLDLATTNNSGNARATIGVASGKWYWECTLNTGTNTFLTGIVTASYPVGIYVGSGADSWGYYSTGQKYTNNSGTSYGASYTNGDVIGVAFDADAGTLTFYKNGVSQGTAFTGLTSGPYFPASSDAGNGSNSTTSTFNFGQRPFAYAAPSGFKALNTQNLPTPTIGATTATQAGKFFNPVLWTGNGANNRAIAGVGFQPDFVWVKSRSGTTSHVVNDVLRGGSRTLFPNTQEAEFFDPDAFVQSFTSDGFNVGQLGGVNFTGNNYVAWNWKANGAGVTNTAGSITSTVSANTTAGFSVVTYTGLGGAGNSVGHGLGAVPRMIIVKQRTNQTNYNWFVYHRSLANTQYLLLNTTNAASSGVSAWNNTTPSSSTFTLGDYVEVNRSGSTFVAYCFAEVPGYNKFGSYTGNGSADGPFIYTGFRPAYVMIKNTTAAGDWVIKDKLRAAAFNPQTGNLYANLTNAEDTTSTVNIDFLANGFKIRGDYSGINLNTQTFIYSAFAESPQKFALAR